MFDLAGLWALSNDALLQKALKLYEAALAGAGYLPAPPKAVEDLVRRVKADTDAGVMAATGLGGPGRSGVVAVIPVWGLITQHPTWLEAYGLGCSAAGIETAVRAALASPEVSAIVLRVNSPGGNMQGLPQLCEFIRAARGAEKPILGHADSNATSAAYMILASCTEAWASPLAMVGSLGCFIVHMSSKGMDEQLGLKRTMIKMPAGKALQWDGEDLSEEGRQEIQALVAAGYGAAVTIVAKGRKAGAGVVQGERFGQGQVLDGLAAAEGGMIDGVRSFQDTLVAAARWRPGKAAGTRAEGQLADGVTVEVRVEGAEQLARVAEESAENLQGALDALKVEAVRTETPEAAAAAIAAAEVEIETFRQSFS